MRLRALSSQLRGITGGRRPAQLDLLEPVLIRYSYDEDRAALEHLAALERRSLAEGAFLLAEVDGELVAAGSLDHDEEPLSDPFRPTATLRELLTRPARQFRRNDARLSVATARLALREAT